MKMNIFFQVLEMLVTGYMELKGEDNFTTFFYFLGD